MEKTAAAHQLLVLMEINLMRLRAAAATVSAQGDEGSMGPAGRDGRAGTDGVIGRDGIGRVRLHRHRLDFGGPVGPLCDDCGGCAACRGNCPGRRARHGVDSAAIRTNRES